MRILLVGLGRLGSRYLQGFLQDPSMYSEIAVLEPSDSSFENGVGSSIGAEVDLGSLNIRRLSIDELDSQYSLCVVATSAAPRANVIEDIVERARVKYWVIEKVLAQSEEQLERILASVEKSECAWVNTPRRRTSLYRKLKSLLDTGTPITFKVTAPSMGMGCNSIHFIDVVSWLVGGNVTSVTIDAPEGWKPSKREGYKEFDGEMTVIYSDGSLLHIDSNPDVPVSIKVKQGLREFNLDESKGISERDCFWAGRLEFQSELSSVLLEDIAGHDMNDGLPTLQQSVDQHLEFFKAIRSCDTLQIQSDIGLPIT